MNMSHMKIVLQRFLSGKDDKEVTLELLEEIRVNVGGDHTHVREVITLVEDHPGIVKTLN